MSKHTVGLLMAHARLLRRLRELDESHKDTSRESERLWRQLGIVEDRLAAEGADVLRYRTALEVA